MSDEKEKSELQRDLEEKRRLAAMGIPTPSPQPEKSELHKDLDEKTAPSKPMQFAVGDDPVASDRQQRIQKERDRKASVDAALAARRPKQPTQTPKTSAEDAMQRLEAVQPDQQPGIPLLSTNKRHPAGELDPETQAIVDRAGIKVHTTPPPVDDGRTARLNNLDGEVRRQRSRIDELFRRLGIQVQGSGGSGCGGDTTTIPNGSGLSLDDTTFTSTGNGKVTLTIETRDYWDTTDGVEKLYHITRNVTFIACAVGAEVLHTTDTAEDCEV